MNTMDRVSELISERGLSLYQLAKMCDVPYSTLKHTRQRSGQLTVDTIERICSGLGIPVSKFFAEEVR